MDRFDKDYKNKREETQRAKDSGGIRFPRYEEVQTRTETKVLWMILGVLCVILVVALVGQEYYRNHTYRKGELAQMSEAEPKQRLKFLTEEEVAVARKNADVGDPNSVAGEDGQPSAADDAQKLIVVETAESVSLKNQLIGILPGIKGPGETAEELIARADRLAAMYDYEDAAALLENCSTYKEDFQMQDAVKKYRNQQAACVEYPVEQVTHVFFHTLIKDPEKAFDGDQYQDGYNQYMVTIDEFNGIIQEMYERGYVMVTLKDMAGVDVGNEGTVSVTTGKILLPKGKIPFVLSQDDVCYYHYMDGDGFASRLIVDENGDIKNEYIEDDGSISVGDYDMVPLIDRFVEEHPDFSYRGAKGYVALTGYDGILGYRTDISYKTRENLDSYQEIFFQEHPDFGEADYERECEESKKVAEAMKEDGWLFASHTWGHVGLGSGSTTWEQFKADTDKWEERVEPLIGETDTLIYAFGGDISDAAEYAGDRFEYLSAKGFHYFCGVDSARYWIQIRGNYVRQARRNIDGYRMYYNPDMLSDLFDVSQVWDSKRPSLVPPI